MARRFAVCLLASRSLAFGGPLWRGALSRRALARRGGASDAQSFIDEVNAEYEARHRDFEEQFWGTKMALGDARYSVD